MANTTVDSYRLGNIAVTITRADHPKKLHVNCNDGQYHAAFTIREYEYKNYKRHMNQRIKNAFNDEHASNQS